MRVFMSGGTTGKSRPTFYTQWDREVGSLLCARALYMQGVRPGDVVLNSWAYGTHNGAFVFDEALYRWLDCVVVTTGTGNVTSSERQVELAIQYEAAAILTTGDYLLRLAELELIERERRMVERRVKEARFPAVKSLDSFDFLALPSLNKTLVLELARSEYVLRRENGNCSPHLGERFRS